MIVANHISYLDGVVLAALFGAPKIIAKAGARQTPVLGKLMEDIEVVFVDKSSKESRQATLAAISEHCRAWRPGMRPLLIFPEGTTTSGHGLIDFKKGAFVSGVPVRPVLLVYTGDFDGAATNFKMTPEGPKSTSDAEWAAQFMGHFVHSMQVRVLAPYMPSEAEQADPELYARNCQALMGRVCRGHVLAAVGWASVGCAVLLHAAQWRKGNCYRQVRNTG